MNNTTTKDEFIFNKFYFMFCVNQLVRKSSSGKSYRNYKGRALIIAENLRKRKNYFLRLKKYFFKV